MTLFGARQRLFWQCKMRLRRELKHNIIGRQGSLWGLESSLRPGEICGTLGWCGEAGLSDVECAVVVYDRRAMWPIFHLITRAVYDGIMPFMVVSVMRHPMNGLLHATHKGTKHNTLSFSNLRQFLIVKENHVLTNTKGLKTMTRKSIGTLRITYSITRLIWKDYTWT